MSKIFVGIFLFPCMVLAQSAPAGIAFTSESQTIAEEAVSGQITIQAQDASGNALKLPSTGCLALFSSASGAFSSNVENWNAVSVLTVNKNSANRNFYYKGAADGTHTLTARLVLKPEGESRSCPNWPTEEWPSGWSASQKLVVVGDGGGGAGGVQMETGGEKKDLAKETQSAPVPSLMVQFSGPPTVWAGADAAFSAQVFGTKKEPIENARVMWNFGNGASREGVSVRFAYNIPGQYMVSVDAASGGLSGTARAPLQVLEPAIAVSRATVGPEGFIEIENGSAQELDLSGWILSSGHISFALPSQTYVLPKTKVAFPSAVTGVFVAGSDARLLFPNGKEAARYEEIKHNNISLSVQNSPPPPPLVKEGEGEGFKTVESSASVVLSTNPPVPPSLTLWLCGVAGVGLLGIAGIVAFRLKPSPQSQKSDAAAFAEKIDFV